MNKRKKPLWENRKVLHSVEKSRRDCLTCILQYSATFEDSVQWLLRKNSSKSKWLSYTTKVKDRVMCCFVLCQYKDLKEIRKQRYRRCNPMKQPTASWHPPRTQDCVFYPYIQRFSVKVWVYVWEKSKKRKKEYFHVFVPIVESRFNWWFLFSFSYWTAFNDEWGFDYIAQGFRHFSLLCV